MTEYADDLIEQMPDGPRTLTRKELLQQAACIAPVPVLLAAKIGVTEGLGDGSANAAEGGLLEATVNASSQTANGTWRPRETDAYCANTGYIDSWSLRF